MKKNFVFITTDHQRKDTIHMIQNNMEVTPNLNILARESIEFENAYTSCPLCVPARTSLATGIFPTKLNVVINDLKKSPLETIKYKTLHEYLQDAGYKVSHFGMQHITLEPKLEDRVNFYKYITDDDYEKICKKNNMPLFGVEEDRVEVDEKHGAIYEKKKYTGSRVSVFEKDRKLYRDEFYKDKLFEYLENENFEEPVAIFLNLWSPHPPLNVLKEYIDKFKNPKLPGNINKICKNEPQNRRKGIAAQLAQEHSIEHWKRVWEAYLGMTSYADEIIGELIQKLKDKDIYENTVIVFTADHGDHLGQHKMYQKMEMYDQAIKIPLLMKIPNVKHKKVETNVSHLDVLPTLLDYLQIENNKESFDGESLFKYIQNNNFPKERFVYSQYSGNQVAIGDIRRAIVGNKIKYIWDGDIQEELFDLAIDPLEMNNLASNKDYFEVKEKLKEKLKRFLQNENDWINI